MLSGVCDLFVHSSIIIICGGFATLVAAKGEVAETGVAIDVTELADDAGLVSVVLTSFSSFISFVAGNVCAANCHFEATVGSGTR